MSSVLKISTNMKLNASKKRSFLKNTSVEHTSKRNNVEDLNSKKFSLVLLTDSFNDKHVRCRWHLRTADELIWF